jgi:uncharacterized membrane protein YdfJ with MMPL/SSD domain
LSNTSEDAAGRRTWRRFAVSKGRFRTIADIRELLKYTAKALGGSALTLLLRGLTALVCVSAALAIMFGFDPSAYIGAGGVVVVALMMMTLLHPLSPANIGKKLGWGGYDVNPNEYRERYGKPVHWAGASIVMLVVAGIYVVARH